MLVVKSHKAILLLPAIAALGVGAFAWHAAKNYPSDATKVSSFTGTPLPSKTSRDGDVLHHERFRDLAPELRKIVLRLEEAEITRKDSMSEYEKAIDEYDRESWDRFAIAEIEKLETGQIAALAEWIYGGAESEITGFHHSIFLVWGSRDPAAARAMLLAVVFDNDLLNDQEVHLSRLPFVGELSQNFHQVRVGHARLDPAAAWREYLGDAMNPDMKHLVGEADSISKIFESYAAKSPGEAWNAILNRPEDAHHMLKGFVQGAPAGQDWEKLATEFVASMATAGKEPEPMGVLYLGGYWLKDDPAAALDWFAGHITLSQLEILEAISANSLPYPDPNPDPFALPGDPRPEESPFIESSFTVEEEERWSDEWKIRLYLLDKIVRSSDRALAVSLLERMLKSPDQEELARTAIRRQFKGSFSPEDISLLQVIPLIRDPRQREQLLLEAASDVDSRSWEAPPPSGKEEDPKICSEAIRELAAKLDLPAEIGSLVEATLVATEKADQKAMEERDANAKANAIKYRDDPTTN